MIRWKQIWVPLGLLLLCCCRKDTFITGSGAQIAVSTDSLHFDTVFTSTGSVTQTFKIFNKNNQKLRISDISLSGGSASFFKLNIDGFPGPERKDLDIAANDSLYVFVTVHIDPSSTNLPYVVQDSIRISFNGNEQRVQLDAWGQNAVFLRSASITGSTTWTNTKPYVIVGGLQVAKNAVLNIQKGARIFVHADAPLLIDGTLKATGGKKDSIVFAGDRLDDPYSTYPGGWPGIFFRDSSTDNVLSHVIVKNAYQGIVAQGLSVNANPKLTLDKCIIDNCYDAGLIGLTSNIVAVNCLISNCGRNIELVKGGSYTLTQCTVASYSNPLIAHKDAVLTVTNFTGEGSDVSIADLDATFTNCVFWGDNGIVDDEVVVGKQGTSVFNVNFLSCLWKVIHPPSDVAVSNMIVNQDPMFVTINTQDGVYDFHLGKSSPALAAGASAGVPSDLDDNPRDPNFPDLGAYEAAF